MSQYGFLETDSGTFYAFYGVLSLWWEALAPDVMSKEVEVPQAVCWFLSFMTQVPEWKAFGLQEENMYVSSFSRSKCHILVLGNRFWHILCILWSLRGIGAWWHLQRSRGSASCLLISFVYDTARVKSNLLAWRKWTPQPSRWSLNVPLQNRWILWQVKELLRFVTMRRHGLENSKTQGMERTPQTCRSFEHWDSASGIKRPSWSATLISPRSQK